ncbi:hypothetical protein AcV5_003235 [Taiwanofungus camphoratus]|nr:hypothetical protein AcV5_003235 [Antrodia cinnamomea]
MRLVRWFSTIVRRSQQQLYEPYVRPLNKEQQRKLRKQELKAASKLHANIRGDLEFLLSKSEASEERKQQRQDVHKQVSSIVESHFGADFEVEDVSLWRYSQDIQEAPFEFVVVDKRHKLGLSGDVDPTTLPGVYDSVQLSKVFLQEGISGVFYSREKLQKNTMKLRYKNGYAIPPTLDVIVNWPKYERQHAKELLYPPTMQATWPVPFYLTLPGPTILPLVDLLKTYCATAPTIIPKLISVLYIWMRSLGIHGFMPMCVALLVTQFLQVSI